VLGPGRALVCSCPPQRGANRMVDICGSCGHGLVLPGGWEAGPVQVADQGESKQPGRTNRSIWLQHGCRGCSPGAWVST
jgi:hypothetical protein